MTPSAGTGNYKEDDYKKGVDNMREAAEIAKPFGRHAYVGIRTNVSIRRFPADGIEARA